MKLSGMRSRRSFLANYVDSTILTIEKWKISLEKEYSGRGRKKIPIKHLQSNRDLHPEIQHIHLIRVRPTSAQLAASLLVDNLMLQPREVLNHIY